jgi:hypothetical protein
MRNVVSVIIWLCAFVGDASAQIEGEFRLDNTSILSYMPVSGEIELRPQSDVQIVSNLEQGLGIAFGAYEIKITNPNGGVRVIDAEVLWGEMNINRGRAPVDEVLKTGLVYVVPVFLLKTREEFLFVEPGRYVVQYSYIGLPGAPQFQAEVNVSEGHADELAEYLSPFWGGKILLRPFDGGGPKDYDGDPIDMGAYWDAFAIVKANQHGGGLVGRYLFVHDLKAFKDSNWCLSPSVDKKIKEGLRWDSMVPASRGMWDIIQKKHAYLVAGKYDQVVEKVDKKGRIIVLGN